MPLDKNNQLYYDLLNYLNEKLSTGKNLKYILIEAEEDDSINWPDGQITIQKIKEQRD